MDEFASEQAQQAARRGNAQSWYERVVPQLTDDERAALDQAIASPQITARTIATVLERWGHPVREGTISAWRRARAR